jgi:hypothetical protein
MCGESYFGSIGTARCDLPEEGTPNRWICAIECGAGDTCPDGLACRLINSATGQVKRCFP